MHKVLLPIDTKSLYYNILNDNLKGHTCTVATPIKQGKATNPYLSEIYKIPKQIDFEKSDDLIRELAKNSKSIIKINNVFVFDKLKINGQLLDADCNFCMFTKEEIDSERAQFGRIKLHYPLSIKNASYSIDNRKVINAISDFLHGYAFLVESFEYDFDDDSLNFNVLLVGYSGIPYSKVFINNKGVGNKYIQDIRNYIDMYDSEIIALRQKYGLDVSTKNFNDYLEKGRAIAKAKVKEYLIAIGASNIRDVSEEYPYSLFDFQYYLDGEIKYCLVFATYTRKKYFNLSGYQNQFINSFQNSHIALVTDIDRENEIIIIDREDIKNYSVLMDVARFIAQ